MFSGRIALLAVLVLGASGIGASCNRSNTGGGGGAAGPAFHDETPGSSTPANAAPITAVPGLDVNALNQTERDLFWAVANDELSPCGDPHSLAACGRDHTCNLCLPALRFLSKRVQDGFPREQLGELVRARYARSAIQTVHTEGAPSRGPLTAPVTVVEFSDYQCPHCGHAAPVLHDIEREFGDRLRVVHMHFPLSMHPRALAASKAAVAAGRQNKFWEFHDLLFANQEHLENADLDRYAQQLGLDLNRFHADSQSPETEAKVAADRREGERLQIEGTPTIFINGRRYPDRMPIERPQLREWVNQELEMPH
jgi:protein-disulfide isomerase